MGEEKAHPLKSQTRFRRTAYAVLGDVTKNHEVMYLTVDIEKGIIMLVMSESVNKDTGIAREDCLKFAKLIIALGGSKDEATDATGRLIESHGGKVDGIMVKIGSRVDAVAGDAIEQKVGE